MPMLSRIPHDTRGRTLFGIEAAMRLKSLPYCARRDRNKSSENHRQEYDACGLEYRPLTFVFI